MIVRKEVIFIGNVKTIAFRVDEEFHMAVKMQSVAEKKTLQEYIIDTLKKDMEEKAKKKK